MLKQYQKPMSMVIIADAEDVLTLSLNTTNVYGIGENRRTTYSFEDSDLWKNNTNA